MIFELRKGIALLLTLSLVACQTPPIGNATQPKGGFNIQSHSKPGLRPFVECVKVNRDTSFTAYFGYENTLGKTVTLPIGGQNKILETGGDSGHPHGRDDDHNRDDRGAHHERDRNPGFSTKSNQNQKRDARKDDKDEKDRSDRDKDKEDNNYSNNRRDRQDRGQPTVFSPGRTSPWPQAPLALVFSQERISWQLGENKATASISDTTQRCSTDIPTPISYSGSSRKTVIPAQVLNLNRQNPQTLNFNLQAAESLAYRFLLNLRHTGNSRVQGLQIYLNGQEIPHAFNANSQDMVLELSGGLLAGQNRLEFIQTSAQNVPLEILLDGYLDPLNVPGAIFSQLPEDRFLLQKPHRKGKIYLKFIEGMKVRIKQANPPQFEDLNGISLTALNQGLQQLGVTEIAQAISAPSSQLDQEELASEAYFQTDVPNQNLFYRLSVSEDANPLLLRMSLRSFPYVEEAFPEYVLDEAYTPGDYVYIDSNQKYFGETASHPGVIKFPDIGTGTQVTKNQFLINTGVMQGKFLSKTSETNAAYASTATPGAWNYWDAKGTIPGDPGVKIAVLDGGFLLDGFKNDNFLNNSTYPSQHEDLDNPNIQPKSNVDPSKYPASKAPYLDIGHGTSMLSLIGASHTPALFSLNTNLLNHLNAVPTDQFIDSALAPELFPKLRTAFENANIRFDGTPQIRKMANEEMWVLKDSKKQWSIQREDNRLNIYNAFPKGGAGIAANTSIYPIHFQYTGAKEESRCLGGTAPAGQCHGLADSIAYAVKLNSNVIVLSSWLDPYTIEADPLVRAEIAKAITKKVTVILASGNDTCSTLAKHTDNAADYNNNEKKYNACIAKYPNGMDIRRVRASRLVMGQESSFLLTAIQNLLGSTVVFSGGILLPLKNTRLINIFPINSPFSPSLIVNPLLIALSDDYTLDMPDIGTIIVGATNLDGSERIKGSVELPKGPGKDGDAAYKSCDGSRGTTCDYAWGITNGNAHGIDVSAPADAYNYTAIFSKNDAPTASGYGSFGGSSGGSAIVGGIVGLMMSQNPSYKNNPKEVRNSLRNTNRDDINNQMAGLVNAYEAVKSANGGALPLPAPTPSADFGTQSLTQEDIADVRPYQLPLGVGVFLTRNSFGQREAVEPADVIGFALKDTIDLSQIEVELKDGNSSRVFNLQEVLHDATAGLKYGSFKLPEDMPTGVKDVIIRLAGTPGVTLAQALEVLAPSRVNIRMSRNILFADGNEKAEVYITVRDAQGQIVPDGSRYFIYGSYPGANPNFYLYDYVTQASSCIGYYCGPPGQAFEVRDGRIHFKLGVGFYINPLLLVEPWPTISSPNFQLRVCQGSSFSCVEDIGPSAEAAGRFFMHHIDSISVVSRTPEAGGTRIEMEVKDILGNPIPVGHVLTFENGGYSQCLLRQDGTAEFGYSRIPVTEPGKIVVKWNSDDISCNRSTYFNVTQGNASGYYLKGSPVFLP